MKKAEHNEYCKNIVNDLENIYNGTCFHCPYCGITYNKPDFDKCLDCGEDLEQITYLTYFSDALDIDYLIASDRETLKGVRILVAFGGPNVYVNTIEGEVQLRWWNEEGEAWLPNEICEAINEEFEELWNC